MIGWLIGLGYLAGVIFTARKVAWWLDDDLGDSDVADKAFFRFAGLFLGLFWPLVLLGALFFVRQPKSKAQLRTEVEQRDQRIAELERELGIGQTR